MNEPRPSSPVLGVLGVLVPLAAAPIAGAQGLTVVSLDPPRNGLAAPTAAEVEVGFDRDLDPATVVAGNVHVFGHWSGVVPGQVSVQPDGKGLLFRPDRPCFPGELVTVALAAAITGQDGSALVGGHAYAYWTRTTPGTGTYILEKTVDTTFPGEGWIQSYGSYAGDLDGDGAPDLSIPNEQGDDVRVLRADGCGGYGALASYALPNNSVPSPNEGADLDGDGDIDLAVGNTGGDSLSLLRGDGQGGYQPAYTMPGGDQVRAVTVADVEGDGDVDVIVANRNSSDLALYENQSNNGFAPAAYFEGGGFGETSLAAVDANSDGWADLFVGHFNSATVGCMLGDGTGTFATVATTAAGGRPWMIAVGDVDGDGDVDMAFCNSYSASAGVVRGTDTGSLQPVELYPCGDFSLAADLGDMDGDGDLDIVTASFNDGEYWMLFNDGAGLYGNATVLPAAQTGSCATLVDYDRDGDLDLAAVDEIADEVRFFQQVSVQAPGVQPAVCGAVLRVDELAGSGGYGGRPAHPVALGTTTFLGVSADPLTPWALGAGAVFDPGIGLGALGLLNVAAPLALASGVTDAAGESMYAVQVPASLPPGATFAFQGLVLSTGPSAVRLTNPEAAVLVP